MRKFGKTPRPSKWKRIWNFAVSIFWAAYEYSNFGNHDDRMKKRSRKTRFDRW
ncbi:MAG: hypothetical protein AAF849_02595 [Bacteroidota bacterium]